MSLSFIQVGTSSSGGCTRARIILGTMSCLLCRIYTRATQGMLMHLSMHNLDSTSIAYNWGVPKGTARTMGSAIREGTFPCASTSVIETTHFNSAYAFSKFLVRLDKGFRVCFSHQVSIIRTGSAPIGNMCQTRFAVEMGAL